MNNVRNNIRKGFTVAPNALINDDSLTPQARFLFVYMASKPDDWKFVQEPMAKSLGWSLPTLRKYIDELIESGWMARERQRVEGKFDSFDYTLNPSPSPSAKNLHLDQVQKIPTWQNTNMVNFSTTNKEEEQINTSTNKPTTTAHAEIFNLKDSEISFGDPDAGIKVAQKMAEFFKAEGRDQWIAMGGRTVGDFPNQVPDDDAVQTVCWDWANSERNISLVPYWRRHVGKLRNWISSYNLKQQQPQYESANSTTRNGRVQQRGKASALLSTDELKQRYGLL